MSTTSQLDDVLTRIQKRERTTRLRSFLYTIIPTLLAAALVVSYISWTNAKQRELDRVKVQAKVDELNELKDELDKQVQGLMEGPAQAYVRPVQFGGELVVATDSEAAREIIERFDASDIASIRTAEIDQVLSEIRQLVYNSDDLQSSQALLE